MTRKDLYKVLEGIEKSKNLVNIADINFTMAIARIESEIMSEIRIIEKGRKEYPEKHKEYLKKKKELDMKFALQKEDGTYQIFNGQLLVKTPNIYYSEVDKLEDEYKTTLYEVIKINKEFTNFLEGECEKTFTKINKSLFPTQLSVEQALLLFPIIEYNK